MTDIGQEIRLIKERIDTYGSKARKELQDLCESHGICVFFVKKDQEEECLGLLKKILARWRTTNNFKVGDKVYVRSGEPKLYPKCIRATVTEISTDGWGYHLRAFTKDLPGIYMFNIWDKDLLPRTDKSMKLISEED